VSAVVADVAWAHALPDTPVSLPCGNGTGLLVSADGSVLAVELATGRVLAARAFPGGALGAALDPLGERALVHGPFGASLWHVGTDVAHLIADGPWCGHARWASSARAAVAVGRRVVVVDAEGTQLWSSEALPSTVTGVSWLGGWRRLAAAAYGGVHLLEPRRGGSTELSPFRGSLLALDSTPDGRWIVSGNQDATLQVFRSDNDTRLEMEGYPGKISRVAFDASGRFLANDGAEDVTVWDFSGPGPRGRAPAMLGQPAEGDDDGSGVATGFAWHPVRPLLAVAWAGGGVVRYDLAEAEPGERHLGEGPLWEGPEPVAVAWPLPDLLLVADSAGRVEAVRVSHDDR
jgi:WD40 repeat protein